MKDWTVSSGSDFHASRQEHAASLLAELAAYTGAPTGKIAKQLQKTLSSYTRFIEKVKKLSDKDDDTVLPEKELAYIEDDPNGLPIFSMIDDNWRCLYLVDEVKKKCTAIRIEMMSQNLCIVEKDRHRYGRKLKSG